MLNGFAVLVELENNVLIRAVAVRYKDIAILGHDHVIRLIAAFRLSRATGRADHHQGLSIGLNLNTW